ncbi:MAG: methyltransferase [Chloroflexi bacterium]|nr:methyltransferase [Chloroflexota bacterium]
MSHSRDDTLAILRGESIARLPVFSGLPSLTDAGLRAVGVRYNDAHTDAAKMAMAAASTFEVCGFESAVVPFDLCVEAEALGGHVDFQTDLDIFMPPVVDGPLSEFPRTIPGDLARAGRIPLVADALRRLRAGVGREIAIGAWMPGPFTLAWQLFGADAWLSALQEPERVARWLELLAEFLARVGAFYRDAGADFLTVHEMGGSPQVLGPEKFRMFVKPNLARVVAQLASPKVLSICGDTNAIVYDLAECGADALHVDQRNDIARTRRLLPRAILLGNLDPVGTLSRGSADAVTEAVRRAAQAGVNAIWPGCDLVPAIPAANLHALMTTMRSSPT